MDFEKFNAWLNVDMNDYLKINFYADLEDLSSLHIMLKALW